MRDQAAPFWKNDVHLDAQERQVLENVLIVCSCPGHLTTGKYARHRTTNLHDFLPPLLFLTAISMLMEAMNCGCKSKYSL
jgi:hypothetical protein